MTADALAGGRTLTVDDAAGFGAGDEILIAQMQGLGEEAGSYETNVIAAVNGNQITVRRDLSANFLSGIFDQGGARATQIVRVPNYASYTIDGTVTAPPWDGRTGGIVAIRASNTIAFEGGGSVNVTAKGFRGPARENGRHFNGKVGEGIFGNSQTRCANQNTIPDTGTGGCGSIEGVQHSNDGVAGSGGGVNAAVPPRDGFAYPGRYTAKSGVPYLPDVSNLAIFGGGGGGQGDSGSNDWSSLAKGGHGGGVVLLLAPTIDAARVIAGGEAGEQGCDYYGSGGDWGVSGGGGGGGGTILLFANNIIGGNLNAAGGPGGDICNHAGQALAHSGGGGRVRVEAGAWVGASAPPADFVLVE